MTQWHEGVDPGSLRVGDRVKLLTNADEYAVKRGSVGTVVAVPDLNSVEIYLDRYGEKYHFDVRERPIRKL